MVQFLFTPWRHRGELLLVRAQFYPHRCQRSNEEGGDRDSADRLQRQRQRRQDHQSSRASGRLSSNFGGGDGDGKDTDGRQQAVDRVSMWMQRGGCPHLVESTAVLTAAALSDEEFMSRAGSDWSGWRSYEVRLAYSTAFGRYVFFPLFFFLLTCPPLVAFSLSFGLGLFFPPPLWGFELMSTRRERREKKKEKRLTCT